MEKRIVGIDLDSTLNCLVESWVDAYNKKYSDNFTINNITLWNWESLIKPECGKDIYNIIKEPGFFANLKVKEDAQEVTQWLITEKNCEIFVVTAYFPVVVLDKVSWLDNYFPHIPSKNIIFCNEKGRFNGDILIDDGAHNIKAFANSNPTSVSILIDSPWNQNLEPELENKLIRLDNWKSIKLYLKEIL